MEEWKLRNSRAMKPICNVLENFRIAEVAKLHQNLSDCLKRTRYLFVVSLNPGVSNNMRFLLPIVTHPAWTSEVQERIPFPTMNFSGEVMRWLMNCGFPISDGKWKCVHVQNSTDDLPAPVAPIMLRKMVYLDQQRYVVMREVNRTRRL